MTTVRYDRDIEKPGMLIDGHAGSAPYGQDLVCAACTILGYTLVNCTAEVPEYMASYFIDETHGVIHVEACPEETHRELCLHTFDVIYTGFEILAAKYPENVRCEDG